MAIASVNKASNEFIKFVGTRREKDGYYGILQTESGAEDLFGPFPEAFEAQDDALGQLSFHAQLTKGFELSELH